MIVRPATPPVCPPVSGQTGAGDLPLIRLILATGGSGFAREAVAFLNSRLTVDHVSYFVLDHEFMPHFLDGASRTGATTALDAGRLYERSMFYRQDPNSACLSRHTGDAGSGPFTEGDTALLASLGPLLIACTAKQVALTSRERPSRSRRYLEGVLTSIEPRLTARERQVCALALTGHTVAAIGRHLRIQQSTVATLRRRAYSKLGISKLNGLFALCIARISEETDVP